TRLLTYVCPTRRHLPTNQGTGTVPEPLHKNISVDDTLNYKARPNVQTRTPWNAPIIWEGMFDPIIYDQTHVKMNTTVALTVFAVGRYLGAYLKTFLTSAEKYFMLGLPVTYFVFTDIPKDVPYIPLAHRRYMKVIYVKKHKRWQDVSMMRMKTIYEEIDVEIKYTFKYVFCFDVDQEFKGHFGSETLGESVAVIHSYFYKSPEEEFTYDRNPESQACMETGDYYYHASFFGGTWEIVKNITESCYHGIMTDKDNDVEALWHDESHLNKYFWFNKPSKLLSPEYCWDENIEDVRDIRITRLVWAPKNYEELRD
uniref:N-acetyllactosaminide alpha-1,3-galactosyltransferase-like n=1 Tax=Gouania willdenowi TaxID=441366 RepID=A0A8C5ERT9_GOUWI